MRKAGWYVSGCHLFVAAACILVLNTASRPAVAQDPPDSKTATPSPSQWKSSPFHGVIGGDGKVIPCRCLFRGTSYGLGEKVCMNTPQGIVMTECDLQQNNTSWVPTSEPCTIS